MNEFLPRSEPISAAAGAIERGALGVRGIQSTTAASPAIAGESNSNMRKITSLAATEMRVPNDDAAAVGDFARVQARIADVIASVQADPSPSTVAAAREAVVSLMPEPVIVLPMPPASQQMIEFAEMIARKMIEQSAQTRAAQASVRPPVVDQLVNG